MSNGLLFFFCVLIWGSTWLAISYQLGEISPAISIALRFAIAAIFLGAYCWLRGLSFRLPAHIHVKMAMVGLCLYTLDYSFLYASQHYLVSAMVALMSSSIIYFNVLFRRWLLGKPIRMEVLVGATLGVAGMTLIFIPAFDALNGDQWLLLGITLAAISFIFASLGNVVSERILDLGAPVVQMNFWAMSYGVLFLSAYAWLSGATFTWPTAPSYYYSLFYLAFFGSVLAFGAYMKLVQQIGSDKSAYVVLMYPLVALLLSTLFEDYQWQPIALIGAIVVLLGNAVAMGKIPLRRKALPTARSTPENINQ